MNIAPLTSSLILIFIFQLTTTIFGQDCPAIEKEPWSFIGKSNGPDTWSKKYPTCGGMQQSPIMLNSDDAQEPNQEPMTIVGYDIPITEAEFSNDGIKAVIIPKDGKERYIQIGNERYDFKRFHFHWSENLNDGTVHGIDEQTYAMEGHFVNSLGEDKYATLAVLYEATSEPNDAFEVIVNSLEYITYKDYEMNYQGEINLNDFLPSEDARAYFNYIGSESNPPCGEGDIWNVFSSIQQVGEDQVMQFKQLYAVTEDEAEPGCMITTNVRRPFQPINDREVYLFQGAGK